MNVEIHKAKRYYIAQYLKSQFLIYSFWYAFSTIDNFSILNITPYVFFVEKINDL